MSRLSTVVIGHSSPQKYHINCRQFNHRHRHRLNWNNGSILQPLSHASILQGLKEARPLQQVHAHIISSGLSDNIFLCNRLMNSYATCGLMADTQKIFCCSKHKNLVSWTILTSALAKYERFLEAFDVFGKMVMNGLMPNEVTIASILPALGNLRLTQVGKSLHCYWIRHYFDPNVVVETALVDMYSKFGSMSLARNLFENMSERNIVSWNTVISGYSSNGSGGEALLLFNLMRRKGHLADVFTVMSLISASSSIDGLQFRTAIHGFTIHAGFEDDKLVRTALMDMYVNGPYIDYAYGIFSEMKVKDVVAWTVMLRGISRGACQDQTIEHLNKMIHMEKQALDSVSFIGILSSCSHSGALQEGKQLHALAVKTGYEGDVFVGSAVIGMYANCAVLEDARNFFQGMEIKDVVCWNAMIAACGMNGFGVDAINLFLQMEGSGEDPNESTLCSVLSACSHAGMVDQGLLIFESMVGRWNIVPNLKHYVCVVDLLGRAGQIYDAYTVIDNMPLQPNSEVYGALLSACRVHCNIHLGMEVSSKILELKPSDTGYYALLSGMYALAGDWERVTLIRLSQRSEGSMKDPGFSSIYINGENYKFMAE